MSEPNALEKLFTNNITREQFKTNYQQLKAENPNDDDNTSVFQTDLTYSLDALYDILDINGDDIIDEQELSEFKKYDESDGGNVLSDADFQILYDKTLEKIIEKYNNKTPEELYDNAVNKSNFKPSIIGERAETVYKSQLAIQISTLQELMSARRLQSLNKIMRFQNDLDDLILKYSNLSKEEKEDYKKNAEKIAQKRKEITEKETLLTSLKEKIKVEENEAAYKKNTSANTTDLETKCNDLIKEISNLKGELNKLTNSQKLLIEKSGGTRSDFDISKKELKRKIELEQVDYENDMVNYTSQIETLSKIHIYAVQQSADSEVISNYSDNDTKEFTGDAKDLKKRWHKNHENLSDGFYNKVIEISGRVGCNADDLMAVMQAESGISTTERNTDSGATGLIQFMPGTANDLGTSTEALSKMSPEQQLVYVERYLMMQKSNAGFKKDDELEPSRLYMLVFSPKYAKRDMNDIIYRKGVDGKKYDWNAGLDRTNKGYITMADLNRALERHKPKPTSA